MAYLVIGNSVIAVGLLLAMIRAGDVSRVSALLFLVPPLAALLAWFMLGEVMPIWAWPGMVMSAGCGADQLAEFVIQASLFEIPLFLSNPFVQAKMRLNDEFAHWSKPP